MRHPHPLYGAMFNLPLAEGRVRALCISSGDFNWSLKDLYRPEDVERKPELVSRLEAEFNDLGIIRAYAPSVAKMSGIVVDPCSFTSKIPLNGTTLCRDPDHESDGTWLRPGEAFIMSGGGCPVAIAEGGGICLVSHVGRESAVNLPQLLKQEPSRTHMSIVDSMAERAFELGVPPGQMTLSVLFQVPASAFGHPLGDPRWQAVLRYVEGLGENIAVVRDHVMLLDMAALVAAQGRRAGFKVDDTVDYALPEKGPFGHTRHPDPEYRLRRNLVIIQYL